ncbi:MAG: FGGY family carbohydrate kinase [Bacteroidales bacterium]|nr:FGGY family carbohydrate kinase [Bacteroidales bacterium]
MYLLGIDIGSSSVKVSLVDAVSGECVGTHFSPEQEMQIIAPKIGWAEQDPETWWVNFKLALSAVLSQSGVKSSDIKAIGISYQMHGLVMVDQHFKPIRPSIIWCDSRGVPYGEKATHIIGEPLCFQHLLNHIGNFTASKLAWIKEHEPQNFEKIHKIMLPGDYIAMKLSGQPQTTISGLSEGNFWDFKTDKISKNLTSYFGFSEDIFSDLVPTFGLQAEVSKASAAETGLAEHTPITYRAGDQPNNALSLNVLRDGDVASTAGTSGVVYGVSTKYSYDEKSRVNSFAHVNHSKENPHLGILLCINGTGILNSWVKKNFFPNKSYSEMNELAKHAPIGSNSLVVMPFGNGAERILNNREIGASFQHLSLTSHSASHVLRAVQEGIVFSFVYGIEIMQNMGVNPKTIKAGYANMFLSPLFAETLAGTTGSTIELYNTDGSIGAARGAGVGAGIYKSFDEAFSSLKKIQIIEPNHQTEYQNAYQHWKKTLEKGVNF